MALQPVFISLIDILNHSPIKFLPRKYLCNAFSILIASLWFSDGIMYNALILLAFAVCNCLILFGNEAATPIFIYSPSVKKYVQYSILSITTLLMLLSLNLLMFFTFKYLGDIKLLILSLSRLIVSKQITLHILLIFYQVLVLIH